jgi:hypothetical protein
MALKIALPTMGPTAMPVHHGYYLPMSQAAAGSVSNAPLVGVTRTANANFQPVVALPASLPNMRAGYNPRVIVAQKVHGK